ncbi:MAG: hypothetical protein L0Z53_02000, partial [Acidobacteriales bacterium]|nr:hypothetical protein [Terriglobales bacterium]
MPTKACSAMNSSSNQTRISAITLLLGDAWARLRFYLGTTISAIEGPNLICYPLIASLRRAKHTQVMKHQRAGNSLVLRFLLALSAKSSRIAFSVQKAIRTHSRTKKNT